MIVLFPSFLSFHYAQSIRDARKFHGGKLTRDGVSRIETIIESELSRFKQAIRVWPWRKVNLEGKNVEWHSKGPLLSEGKFMDKVSNFQIHGLLLWRVD